MGEVQITCYAWVAFRSSYDAMSLNHIMLVDDEADIRTIAELALVSIGGWDVALAESGQDALTQLAKQTVDLVLLDVMMPDMDGPTVLRRMRDSETLAHIPIIFMTAKVQRREIDHFIELGALGVIGKPFDPMQVSEEIRRIMGER